MHFCLNFHVVSACLKKKQRFCLTLLIAVLAGCSESSAPDANQPQADQVFHNGRVYTVNSNNDIAEAVAVKDGKIIAVGSNAEVEGFIGKTTDVVDLKGRMLMPGLVDGHMHPIAGGAQLTSCSLGYQSLTVDEVLAMITACLEEEKGAPSDRWLQANSWFRQAMKPEGADLTAEILDRLPTDRPVVVTGSDFHSMAANSKAIEAAAITQDTPDPSDGKIVRDDNGEATGIFLDGAMWMVNGAMPKLSDAEQHKKNLIDLEAAIQALNAQGITSIFDAAAREESMASFAQLQKNGKLSVRASLAPVISPEDAAEPEKVVANIKDFASRFNTAVVATEPGIVVGTAKMFVDGVIQAPAQTGALVEPYLHNTGAAGHAHWQPSENTGSLYFSEDLLTPLLNALAANDIDAHMHTTGDKAIKVALNAIAATRAAYADADFRPALAHNELVAPEDYSRFAQLNVIPMLSFQWGKPAPDTIDSVKDYIGPERFLFLETAGKFKQAGVRIAYGSDWPVDPLNDWMALQVGVSRTNPSATDPKYQGRLGDDPGLDVQTAIRTITLNSAYALGMDDYVGSLEVGKFADMIVIDQDITAVAPEKIGATKVLLTVIGGREVYRASSF